MSTSLAYDTVTGPLGTFRVSTIVTIAGGGENKRTFIFQDSDFETLTTWPFETMIFPERSQRGLYHAPHATKEEALAHHALMVDTIKQGLEFGGGVDDSPFGNPTITPEQWKARMAAKK